MTSSEYRKLSVLLSNIQNGARESFADIYFMYSKKVYFLFCKLLKNKGIAMHMTIEFFDYVYLRSTTFNNAAVFEKWLYNSLFSRCRRYIIDNTPEIFSDYTDTDSTDGDAIDELFDDLANEITAYQNGIDITVDMMKTVDLILSEMPLKLRSAILMYYFCGFEMPEIASAEQIELLPAKNRLLKAIIRLKTEEHKYSQMGYDCKDVVIFIADVFSAMAENIVVPPEIPSGLTSRIGISCIATDSLTAVLNLNTPYINSQQEDTSYINTSETNRQSGYVAEQYGTSAPKKVTVDDTLTPAIKILAAVIALLVIVAGTLAVILAINNKNSKNDDSPDETSTKPERTTISEISEKETTTKHENVTKEETTTEEESRVAEETTTEAETATEETTSDETTAEETTTIEETTTEEETTTMESEPEDF